jgi:hypothetical protein
MGTRKQREKQEDIWIAQTELPSAPGHPFYQRQHRADCEAESSDMLLYLAGVNGHAVFRIVGSKRWSVAHFLKTIQYLSAHAVPFLTTRLRADPSAENQEICSRTRVRFHVDRGTR